MKTVGDSAVGAELFFANDDMGGAVSLHQKIGGLTVSLGKVSINDKSFGATAYGEASDSDRATGSYVGLSYGIFSARLTQYDTNHSYTGSKTIPAPTSADPKATRTLRDTTTSSASRRLVWVGILRNF